MAITIHRLNTTSISTRSTDANPPSSNSWPRYGGRGIKLLFTDGRMQTAITNRGTCVGHSQGKCQESAACVRNQIFEPDTTLNLGLHNMAVYVVREIGMGPK